MSAFWVRGRVEPMLSVSGISKSFLGRTVVDDVSFDVGAGEIVAFLGPNGAGKTTTMRMIAGILEPDSGTILCGDYDMWEHRLKAQSLLGYLPEGAPLYGEMTALSYLGFMCETRAITKARSRDVIAMAVARTSLEDVLQRPIETLSKGFKRRVALAGAILHDPPILILDEPTDGLDPNQKRAARALIRSLSPGRAILISTHVLEEVSAMCSRAIVVAKGTIVADQTPAELALRTPSGSLEDAFQALSEPWTYQAENPL
jgi:ABC-2 type transport system ATP-binding protein